MVLESVENYYTQKVIKHGCTSKGVDWNTVESQFIRFDQLMKLIDLDDEFSINDLGCGFGSLLDYFKLKDISCDYLGIDLSNQMISFAKKRNHGRNIKFIKGSKPNRVADFTIASGLFNVRLNISDKNWLEYIFETLDILNNSSNKGFAFNCLSSYADKEKMRGDLFYADPNVFFDKCKREFSHNVALFHDYNLYEFTIVVRK